MSCNFTRHLVSALLIIHNQCTPFIILNVRQEKKRVDSLALALALALSLALTLILSHNHLANDLLWTNSPLYGLMYCSMMVDERCAWVMNAVHCGASMSKLYGVFVLHWQLNILFKALPLKVSYNCECLHK